MTAPHLRIPLDGELTIFPAAATHQCLLAAITDGKEIEVDLSQVGEIDTAGLQLMVAAKHEALAHGKVLRFTGHSPTVRDLLDLANLAGFFGDPVIIHKGEKA